MPNVIPTPSGEELLRRVWPANMYDAIKERADALGGVGAGQYFAYAKCAYDQPCCIMGFIQNVITPWCWLGVGQAFGVDENVNDAYVRAKRPRGGRVPFDQYARDLGIVRGDYTLDFDAPRE